MTDWSSTLRTELCARARAYADHARVDAYLSKGKPGVVLFPRAAGGEHHGEPPRAFERRYQLIPEGAD